MIKSRITLKEYDPEACVYLSNMLQAKKYLDFLGPEFLLDILWDSNIRKDSLIFVFPKCPETREAKSYWDKHEL